MILVTGGAGYIGSFMTKRLLDEGRQVVVFDSLERGKRDAVDNRAEFVQGSILDTGNLDTLFNSYPIETVIHFAGLISMAESTQNPFIYFQTNTFGSMNLLESMVRHDVKKIIFSSTAGVYGNPESVPISEDHPKNPTNPYGESKLMFEKILEWYSKSHSVSSVSLRYFNASGASLDGLMGENHVPETHIIPIAIGSALSNTPFNLYGIDYDTPDGTCIRDYIHVLDLVEAHVLAINKLEEGKNYHYNVGTGNGYSNKEIIEMVKRVSGIDFKVQEKERRPGDANILVANPEKIKSELGFDPKYSDLQEIVETAWKWHRMKAGTIL